MRSLIIVAGFMISCFAPAPLASAKEVRDGSTYERAIIIPANLTYYADWEWDYLQKRLFDVRSIPKEHALRKHNGQMYDRFVFSTPSGEKIVIFDVTSFHGDLAKELHPK